LPGIGCIKDRIV